MKTEAGENEEGDVVYNLLSAFQLPTQLGVDSGKTTFARISRDSRLNKKLSAHDKEREKIFFLMSLSSGRDTL